MNSKYMFLGPYEDLALKGLTRQVLIPYIKGTGTWSSRYVLWEIKVTYNRQKEIVHYSDVIMDAMASHITSLAMVY